MNEPVPSVEARAVSRLAIVDMLRGLVVALMVLDHVRAFFHRDALVYPPTDATKTTVVLFATRWVTHLCAPTFVLLSGVSVYLQRANGKRGVALSRFLLLRGVWLIVLELTIVAFGFNFAQPFVFLQVIWAIGVGMLLLSALTWAPPAAVFALGATIVAAHGVVAATVAGEAFASTLAWTVMMKPGLLGVAPGLVSYPALPWFGIMAMGYGAGGLFLLPREQRDRWLIGIGASFLVGFAVLRAFNGFGDPRPWDVQATPVRTALSFLDVSKYPPSLLYVLATLGVSLVVAPGVGRIAGPVGRMLLAFGRTPLFTYLLHLYIAHGAAVVVGMAAGLSPAIFTNFLGDPSRLTAAGWGVSLPAVYALWLAILLMLWPLSARFAAVKQRRRDWWLSYL